MGKTTQHTHKDFGFIFSLIKSNLKANLKRKKN